MKTKILFCCAFFVAGSVVGAIMPIVLASNDSTQTKRPDQQYLQKQIDLALLNIADAQYYNLMNNDNGSLAAFFKLAEAHYVIEKSIAELAPNALVIAKNQTNETYEEINYILATVLAPNRETKNKYLQDGLYRANSRKNTILSFLLTFELYINSNDVCRLESALNILAEYRKAHGKTYLYLVALSKMKEYSNNIPMAIIDKVRYKDVLADYSSLSLADDYGEIYVHYSNPDEYYLSNDIIEYYTRYLSTKKKKIQTIR